MKIMLCVQGEGRGHMSQAIAVKEMLEAEGHRLVSVVVGLGKRRQMPPYFEAAMGMPITLVPTLEFVYKDDKAVNLPSSAVGWLLNIPAYWRSVRLLKSIVRDVQPDMILNLFEPLTGIYALTNRRRPPIMAVAHQFMFEHPGHTRAPGLRFQQFMQKLYVRVVGAASTRLALSLYDAPDLPKDDLFVCPPLLRQTLFKLEPKAGDIVLVYLLNHGYSEQIIRWHRSHPRTVLHCFYDKPGEPEEFLHDATLTFHTLAGEKFLRLMAGCRFVVCTAGFESVCEAAYLGKPLLMVPVENHVEQRINALDCARIGLGATDSSFDLDRLEEMPDTLDNASFRAWVRGGNAVLLRTMEYAARRAS